MKKKRLITAALPYINNVPHLGHMAGSHLPADIFARFCRLKGYETVFVGGSDENGTPSELAARELDLPIKEFLDVLHLEHKKIYQWFDISYDNYSRTSNEIHHKMTQEFFKKIYENGFVERETIKMFYDQEAEMFLADRYIKGECPKCGFKDANGDQCEKCASVLTPLELVNPISTVTKTKPIIKETEHLFLNLPLLSKKLEDWVSNNKNFKLQVSSLALGWIKEGLRKRGISRDLKNGVKIPLEGMEDKVFYVWFDAPIGYVSSSLEYDKDSLEKYWKSDDTEVYHFLGKDNIPFHTIFWPAVLMAHGNINLPHNVIGLQYLNYEGGKFSKSKKRGVFCEALPSSGINVDILRAYLISILPENSDSEFKWLDFQQKINSELIANLGNYINRILAFSSNKLEYVVKPQTLNELDKKFIQDISDGIKKYDDYLEEVEIKKAYLEILSLSSIGNKYFDDNQPWKVVKEDPERTRVILYLCVYLVKVLAVLLIPFLPKSAQKIWGQLGFEGDVFECINYENLADFDMGDKLDIGKPSLVFEKITDDVLSDYQEKMMKMKDLKDFF